VVVSEEDVVGKMDNVRVEYGVRVGDDRVMEFEGEEKCNGVFSDTVCGGGGSG
jgi:hypothetical protein